MKKLITILICITMIIALVACSNNYDDLSSEEETAHEINDSESINDQGYSVSPINTFTSFDEIVNVWSECLDIDFEACNYINADNEVRVNLVQFSKLFDNRICQIRDACTDCTDNMEHDVYSSLVREKAAEQLAEYENLLDAVRRVLDEMNDF